MGSINPYQTLVSNPDVALEFKSKVEELSRRLKANGFNYQNDYSVMNDRQRDIFTTGLFVIPEQADSIEEYVEFGHDNCECPDVMDDLNETCPMLMQGVTAINEREQVRESNTFETTLDLLIEQCIEEVFQSQAPRRLNEKRGVAHQDKMGKKIKNKEGEELELTGFQVLQVKNPPEITNQKDLVNAVAQIAKSKNATVLFNNKEGQEDSLTGTTKGAILVLAKDASDKNYLFVKYGGTGTLWKEKEFATMTGWTLGGTQASKEILAIGPDIITNSEQIRPLANIPGALDAGTLSQLDSELAKSLPAYLEAAVSGQDLPLLNFESTESRDRYLSSLYKYLSEVMGPIFLATGNQKYLANDAVLNDALENLLKPVGVNSWTESTGISWPSSKNERLKDSIVHYGDKQDVFVSSKAKAGANPSLAELYKGLADLESNQREELVKLYGPGNDSGINLYTGNPEDPGVVDIMADRRHAWWSLPLRIAAELSPGGTQILTEDEYNKSVEIFKNSRANQWRTLETDDQALLQKLQGFKQYIKGNTQNEKYREALHIIAGLAILTQNTINKTGIFTNFGKAMYNRFPLVQIYAKKGAYMPDGETGVKSGPLEIIYPARFDGEMYVDAAKNYFSTGNKGKMTIKIKY